MDVAMDVALICPSQAHIFPLLLLLLLLLFSRMTLLRNGGHRAFWEVLRPLEMGEAGGILTSFFLFSFSAKSGP